MFYKIGTLKSFENFTGKHPRWSLFLTKLKETIRKKERDIRKRF